MTGSTTTPGYLNGDGFGLGWYSPHPHDVTPCVYRQARPAWNDPNLGSIAEKVYTPVLFAHVRAATPGLDVSETTCHPFRYGRYLWMHNGGLGNFLQVRRYLLPTLSEKAFDFAVSHGSSDTALCFAVFLNLIDDHMASCEPEHLRHCLERTILILKAALRTVNATETSLLNFVVSDGDSLVASRHVIDLANPDAGAASLYYASGSSYEPDKTTPGSYAMIHTDRRPSLAIVSSEPLTEERADWVSVPINCTVVITKSMHILVSPVADGKHSHISTILANLQSSLPAHVANKKSFPTIKTSTFSGYASQFSEQKKTIAAGTRSPESFYLRPRNEKSAKALSPSTISLAVGSTVQSTIVVPERTVLCCTIMGSLLLSGSENGTIHVWNMEDNVQKATLKAGKSAVLALLADEKRSVLVSASSASLISVFSQNVDESFEQRFVICCEGKGDVLSLTSIGSTLFAGFSDSNVRCIPGLLEDLFPDLDEASSVDCTAAGKNATRKLRLDDCGTEFPNTRSANSHYGYVFAMTALLGGRYLCTGCGDGILRIWDVQKKQCVQTRDDHAGAILVLAAYEVKFGTMIFSGSRDCSVKVWVSDGDSGFICKRTLRKHKDEVVFLTVCDDKLISGSADGNICVWCVKTLAVICQYKDNILRAGAAAMNYGLLFTASDDGAIHVRDIVSTEKSLLKKVASSSRLPQAAVPEMAKLTNAFHSNLSSKGILPGSPQGNRDSDTQGDSSVGTSNGIISEVVEDADDIDTIIPGVSNELILAPPLSPLLKSKSASNGPSTKDSNGSTHEENGRSSYCSAGDEEVAMAMAENRSRGVSSRIIERRFMRDVLARFVSFATVSGSDEHRESCWQGARYLGSFLEELGASVKLVPTNNLNSPQNSSRQIPRDVLVRDARLLSTSGSNPIVLARFACSNPEAKTIVCYGHYDVMPVDVARWDTYPWTLTEINGYFCGRGCTDNKGPIMAIVFAIKKLLEGSKDGLGSNIVLVFQGEGEKKNVGFKEAIRSHMHWFENTSLILTSNSTWLGEETPCITYGFRGVIELLVSVTGGDRNLHSGVDGGATLEPMNDLITILGTLVDAGGVVCIPGFYDEVRALDSKDEVLLEDVEFDIGAYRKRTGIQRFTAHSGTELLKARWKNPSISVTSIDSSNGSGFYSVVPCRAQAKISVRFVPNQSPEKLERAIATHLQFELRKRRSPNVLKVECVNKGDWWLGDPSREHFQIAAKAVREVWGVEPQYVCEGGSMPLFSFLVKTLNAPLVQVPLGQSSDSAHLPNERMRTINLYRGKEVMQKIIEHYATAEGQKN